MVTGARFAGLLVCLGLAPGSACRSACFDPDQPACVDRYDGTWMVAHRLTSGLEDRDVRDGRLGSQPAFTLRGDAALGTTWSVTREGETLIVGFPEAGAVGLLDIPRAIGSCSAQFPRLLAYIADDTLNRQPRLQVRVSGCDEADDQVLDLFAGPSDFGREVLGWSREDGTWDLWVAAPLEGLTRGAVFRFNDATTLDAGERGFDQAQMLEGQEAGEQVGATLRRCGDLNGDGEPELAIGVPGYGGASTLAPAGSLAGAVVVLTPAALAAEGDWSFEDATAILTGAAGDRAGTDVRCDSDVDGDGTVDLLVGAPYADSDTIDAGAVYLVSGGDGWAGGSLADRASVVWTGAAAGEGLGMSVSSGDLNGDGVPELIAGAPGADGSGAGGIRVLDGVLARTTPEPGVLYVAPAAVEVDGVGAAARAGTAVAAADLDEDGQLELVSAAWRLDRDGVRLHAGQVFGWSGAVVESLEGGSEGDVAFSLSGTASHQEVGRVLVVEDVNNDGDIEIVTTARRRAQ